MRSPRSSWSFRTLRRSSELTRPRSTRISSRDVAYGSTALLFPRMALPRSGRIDHPVGSVGREGAAIAHWTAAAAFASAAGRRAGPGLAEREPIALGQGARQRVLERPAKRDRGLPAELRPGLGEAPEDGRRLGAA